MKYPTEFFHTLFFILLNPELKTTAFFSSGNKFAFLSALAATTKYH